MVRGIGMRNTAANHPNARSAPVYGQLVVDRSTWSVRPVTSWQRPNPRYQRTPITDCAVDRVDAERANSERCEICRPVIGYLESDPCTQGGEQQSDACGNASALHGALLQSVAVLLQSDGGSIGADRHNFVLFSFR
jgi:hypothetical protein